MISTNQSGSTKLLLLVQSLFIPSTTPETLRQSLLSCTAAMNLLEKLKIQQKKEPDKSSIPVQEIPVYWFETSDSVTRHYKFETDGQLSVKVVDDSRPVYHRIVGSLVNKFFPSGYPYSVNEGYLRYMQFRAMQHFTSAALSVLSTQGGSFLCILALLQSLLFAAGLRPAPAQATVVSWILKDGMHHVGKIICSNLGARMDSESKCWRILADVLYDFGTGLEVLSPLCPNLFLEMAGLGNFAKGMAVVAARATRLPIYSSFAKEGNLGDLSAKDEAILTLFNVAGIGVGSQLASTICSSMQGKAGKISSPADLRYQENLLFPGRLIEDAGSVKVGRALHKIVKPSKLQELQELFAEEKFSLSPGNKYTDMVLEQSASGEDALRGWLVAAYTASMEKSFHNLSIAVLQDAYEKMNSMFNPFLSELQAKGWHTNHFLDGTGSRFAY